MKRGRVSWALFSKMVPDGEGEDDTPVSSCISMQANTRRPSKSSVKITFSCAQYLT